MGYIPIVITKMMKFQVQPWKHQLEAITRASARDEYALFFEMGAGKTGTLINILRGKFNTNKRYLKTLILCPPIVIKNWADEFAKHSKIPSDKICLLTGSGSARLKRFQRQDASIYITNYESLLMPELYKAFQSWGTEVLVLDESHRCKDYKAKRTKLAIKLANGEKNQKTGEWIHYPIQYRYLLSGSPILNSLMDLFSQFWILDGGKTFGDNFFQFRGRYFTDRNASMPRHKYFPDWRVRPTSAMEVAKKIEAISMRVEKKDCLDLPPLVRQTIKVGMTPEQTRMYAQMKKDLITFLETPEGSTPVAATMALTKALRLMQIASGFVKTVEGDDVSLQATPKLEALQELLTEMVPNHKVIVWAVFKENYAQIRALLEKLGITHVEITGDTPPGHRFEMVEKFNSDPECRVFLGHPGSSGIGINLVSAPVCIFYSRTFSLEQSLQAEARNHRGGSEIHPKITRLDLVCEDTIDELVTERLASKQEISAGVLKNWLAK